MKDINLDGIYSDYPIYLNYLEKLSKVKRKISSFKRAENFKRELEEYQFLKENRDANYFDINGLYEDEMYLFQHDNLNRYISAYNEKKELLHEFKFFLSELAFFNVDYYCYLVCLNESKNNYKFIDLKEHDILTIYEDDNTKVNYLISVLQAANSFIATIRQEDLPFITNLIDDWDIIHDDIKGRYFSPSFENDTINMGIIYYLAYMNDRNLVKKLYPSSIQSSILLKNSQYDDSFFEKFDDSDLIKKMFTNNIEKLYKKCNYVDKEKILNYYHELSTFGFQIDGEIISLFTTSPVINIELLKRKHLKK